MKKTAVSLRLTTLVSMIAACGAPVPGDEAEPTGQTRSPALIAESSTWPTWRDGPITVCWNPQSEQTDAARRAIT